MRQKMRQSLFFYFFSALILSLLFELSNLDFLISNLVYTQANQQSDSKLGKVLHIEYKIV